MKIVIVGAGEVGSHLAKMLSQEWNDITVIDSDAERLARLNTIVDVVTIEGSPSSIKVMKEAEVQRADLSSPSCPSPPGCKHRERLARQKPRSQTSHCKDRRRRVFTSENRLFFSKWESN